MTTSNSKKFHLHGPKLSKYVNHQMEISLVDNCHRYEMRCLTCGDKHVKWSSEWEYLWYEYRKVDLKKSTTFRQLFWAPLYDEDYQTIHEHVKMEREDARYSEEREQQLLVEYENRFYEKHTD